MFIKCLGALENFESCLESPGCEEFYLPLMGCDTGAALLQKCPQIKAAS